jgi:exonuclease SbcC
VKLVALRLENFRCFEHCELDLQRDGLIGISGPNGSGKTTLLEALNYALYGRGRGSRQRPPERDGMQKGERCEVEVEFLFDERHYKVLRGPKKVLLEVDGETRLSSASGQEALTEKVTEILGVGQLNFAMTFYARQREIQALNPGDPRRTAQLEALLGIDRVRNAADSARESVREQEAVVRGVESNISPLAEARSTLKTAEEEAARHGPEVEKATKKKDEAAEARAASWQRLTEACGLAEEVFAVEAKVAVALGELETSRDKEKATSEALADAERAAAELEEIEPTAAKADELSARDSALEMERKVLAQSESLRERRHQAEVAAVAAADRLQAEPDPGPGLEEAEESLEAKRRELDETTGALLAASKEQEDARAAMRAAKTGLETAERAAELDEELEELRPLRDEAAEWTGEVAALKAEAVQLAGRIDDEREHFSHLKEDGPKATCPRCKRPYEGDYKTIVAEFTETLTGLEEREAAIAGEVAELGERLGEAAPKLERLQSAEGERAVLVVPDLDLKEVKASADASAQVVEDLTERSARLATERDVLTAAVAELEGKIGPLRTALGGREKLVATREAAERDRVLFDEQLSELSTNGYEAEEHEKVRESLAEALAARERCAGLRAQAEQHELLLARREREREAIAECERAHSELSAAAVRRAGDKTAQEKAEANYEAKDEALGEADRALGEVKLKSILESSAVAEARTKLEQAEQQRGKLDSEKRESALRRMVQSALESYRSAIQQEAVPSLEQETADLLRRVTRGRYSDVTISSEGELHISDRGESHALDRFSGGEQDIANLCMRIALSKILARRNGAEANFIVLDEVFGSQDQDRRAALVEALRELDQEFAQVLIVSHVRDFMEHCGLQITVDTNDGASQAKIQSD